MAHFAKYRLFRGWFQVLSVVSWLVSGSFGWFQVVPGRLLFKQVHRRSYKKTVYRLAGAYPGNSVGRGELGK